MRRLFALCTVVSIAFLLSACNDECVSQQDYEELKDAYVAISDQLSDSEKAIYACEEIVGLAADVQDKLSGAWCILGGQDMSIDPDEAAYDLELAYSICQQIIDAANGASQ